MSTAFEITSEDVRSVMEINGRPVDEATAEKLLHDVIAPEDGRIEKAALYGNEMEEQTVRLSGNCQNPPRGGSLNLTSAGHSSACCQLSVFAMGNTKHRLWKIRM